MRTEADIIYTIWDVIRAGTVNADDPIVERLMRQFLSIHRGKILNQYYKKGTMIPDECFQDLGAIIFSFGAAGWTSPVLPKLIRFEDGNYGLMFDKDGFVLSILNSEEFTNSIHDSYNKFQPRMKFINNKLTLDLGQEQSCDDGLDDISNSALNITVRKIKAESLSNAVTISGQGVLVNPDDEVGYDFTTSPYPLPDELIESMVNSVNAREFNLFLKVKSDETGDIKHSTAEYDPAREI